MSETLAPRDDTPDFLEPIIAWRAWNILQIGHYARLTSTTRDDEWPIDAPMEAVCNRDSRPQPVLLSHYEVQATPEMVGAFDGITFSAQFTLMGRKEDIRRLMTEGVRIYVDGRGELRFAGEEEVKPVAPPHRDHRCGIYAVADPDHIPAYADIWGAVELTGRVVPGEHGWRAQRARVIFLALPPYMEQGTNEFAIAQADLVAKTYNVPLVDWQELPKTSDPEEVLRGHR